MAQEPGELARHLIGAARQGGRTSLDEFAGKQVLAAYGIDVPRSVRIPVAGPLPDELHALTAPYVLKVMSADVLHKSDVGGVRLGLRDAEGLIAARDEMARDLALSAVRVDGFLVEETAPRGHDVVIGGMRDPGFGQVLMFGLGGIFVEVLRDVSFRVCPIEPVDAREMIAELRGATVLSGARGGLKIDEQRVVDLLMTIGGPRGLLMELDKELDEVDLNPVIVSEHRAVAVDARLVLSARLGNER